MKIVILPCCKNTAPGQLDNGRDLPSLGVCVDLRDWIKSAKAAIASTTAVSS